MTYLMCLKTLSAPPPQPQNNSRQSNKSLHSLTGTPQTKCAASGARKPSALCFQWHQSAECQAVPYANKGLGTWPTVTLPRYATKTWLLRATSAAPHDMTFTMLLRLQLLPSPTWSLFQLMGRNAAFVMELLIIYFGIFSFDTVSCFLYFHNICKSFFY